MDQSDNCAGDAGKVRLQLAIARSGLCSRRHAEELIASGRVNVNGRIISEMGVKVNPASDRIEVDGKPLPTAPAAHTTIMLNKPPGYLCAASDGHGGRLVTELVSGVNARLVPVGRLDRDSSGLLLMSDDGDLIARTTHPRYGHRKVYVVEVSGECGRDTIRRLREPMDIDGYLIRPVDVRFVRRAGRHTVLRFTLGEGRNRQIRKMCAAVGLNVISLTRVAIEGVVELGDLPEGKWRALSEREVAALMDGAATRSAAEPANNLTQSPQRPQSLAGPAEYLAQRR